MPYSTADLEQAHRHVSHSEKMVLHQQAIVDEGGLDDRDRHAAENWLAYFKAGLAKHIAQRNMIMDQISNSRS